MEPSSPNAERSRSPWAWVPSLYFAQGIPYVVVMTVAVIMFKRLGVSNSHIAYYTSVLYLPWVLKPLWSPIVQRIGTRRSWVIVMQLLVGVGLGAIALVIPSADFVRYTLAAFAFVAIASATHDIAADGFYLLALNSHQQAWFVGIRSTAYRMASIVGQGILIMLAGQLEVSTGLPLVTIQASANAEPGALLAVKPEGAIADGDDVEQRVLTGADQVALSVQDRTLAEAKTLIAEVRDWNVEHGFYPAPEPQEAIEKNKSQLANQLKAWIQRLFDRLPDSTGGDGSPAVAGDMAIVYMKLAKPLPASEEQVVQIGRASGDPSFQIVEGERFVVSDKNWDQPFLALIQVEAKLDQPSKATFEVRSGNLTFAWSTTFFVVAGLFALICIYHFFMLPRPAGDHPPADAAKGSLGGFVVPIVTFFQKPKILALLAFLLLYRLPESQLVKLAAPFLIDPREKGGLALTTGEVGFVYGTVGVAMLMLGGVLGGFVAARHGLKRWLWPMALIIHLPNAAFLFLAMKQPDSLWVITAAVGVEQFGYGFGFTAYMLYCIYIARGEHQTVHYALCTGAMALGMMIPGMWSGWLQDAIGYENFFVWVMICTIPSFATVAFIPLDGDFGKKTTEEAA